MTLIGEGLLERHGLGLASAVGVPPHRLSLAERVAYADIQAEDDEDSPAHVASGSGRSAKLAAFGGSVWEAPAAQTPCFPTHARRQSFGIPAPALDPFGSRAATGPAAAGHHSMLLPSGSGTLSPRRTSLRARSGVSKPPQAFGVSGMGTDAHGRRGSKRTLGCMGGGMDTDAGWDGLGGATADAGWGGEGDEAVARQLCKRLRRDDRVCREGGC